VLFRRGVHRPSPSETATDCRCVAVIDCSEAGAVLFFRLHRLVCCRSTRDQSVGADGLELHFGPVAYFVNCKPYRPPCCGHRDGHPFPLARFFSKLLVHTYWTAFMQAVMPSGC
jgi:hypothetical protein